MDGLLVCWFVGLEVPSEGHEVEIDYAHFGNQVVKQGTFLSHKEP